MIVDDRLLMIGSANLSNRSFGLDTECNLAIASNGDARIAASIRAMRDRLLCEHLAVTHEVLGQAMAAHPRLNDAIRALHRPQGRTLEPFTPSVTEDVDAALPDAMLLDPMEPIDTEQVVAEFIGHEAARARPAAWRCWWRSCWCWPAWRLRGDIRRCANGPISGKCWR